jgi:hypothetical protein
MKDIKGVSLFIGILVSNLIGYGFIAIQYSKMQDKINFLENAIIYKENFNAKIINSKLKNKIDSVLSIRCQDSKNVSWRGTGTKIDSHNVLTADHMVFNTVDISKKYPFYCEFYDDGVLVGMIEIDGKINHKVIQVNNRDMALINVKFNDKGSKISFITPKIVQIVRGLPLILVSHPLDFKNDKLTTFGLVVNSNVQNSLPESRQLYWSNAIMTDMSASPGSSGAPLFNTNGDFIGIHVGGERSKGLNLNYQLLFDKEFFTTYENFKKIN